MWKGKRKLLHFLKLWNGYLLISVSGYSPERFMNLCSNKNILLWNIQKQNDFSYNMYISLKAFWKIRPVVRKTKTKVVIIERFGLPFFVQKMKYRYIFLFSFIIAFSAWFISSLFVWEIKIDGNLSITNEQITKFLETNSVYVGQMKNKIPLEELEQNFRQCFDAISWTSIQFSGTSLCIYLTEVNDISKLLSMDNNTKPCLYSDLISDHNGVVKNILVRNGEAAVEPGDEVSKGDVLVYGYAPIYNDDLTIRNYQYYQSDADVYIEFRDTYSKTLEEKYIKKRYTGREKISYYFRIMTKEFYFTNDADFLKSDKVSHINQISFFHILNLPLYWGKIIQSEYVMEECLYNSSMAKDILNKNFLDFCTSLNEKGVQIIQKNATIERSGEKYILNADYVAVEKASSHKKYYSMENLKVHE